MIGGILKLIGMIALLGAAFFAGMQYQKSKTMQKIVAEKVQQQTDKLMERIK